MDNYTAIISWSREGAKFTDARFSRGHLWAFDGGIEVPASASPHLVPSPFSVAAAVDPEEAFVASLSSCHMLWFLHIASKQDFVVDRYRDEAVGVMAKNAEGRLAMTEVTLRPEVAFAGEKRPSAAALDAMHHEAHEECFIASSVKTVVKCDLSRSARGRGESSEPPNRELKPTRPAEEA